MFNPPPTPRLFRKWLKADPGSEATQSLSVNFSNTYQVALGIQTLPRAGAVAALTRLRAQAGGREVCAETPAVGGRPAAQRCPAPGDPREGAPGPRAHFP